GRRATTPLARPALRRRKRLRSRGRRRGRPDSTPEPVRRRSGLFRGTTARQAVAPFGRAPCPRSRSAPPDLLATGRPPPPLPPPPAPAPPAPPGAARAAPLAHGALRTEPVVGLPREGAIPALVRRRDRLGGSFEGPRLRHRRPELMQHRDSRLDRHDLEPE